MEIKDYQSNSHKSKEIKKDSREKEPERRVQPIALKGTARTKKKSGIRKFADVFIADDIGKVKDYVLFDVLRPAIKDAIEDIVSNGIHILLYGEQSGSSKKKTPGSNISYQKYYDGGSQKRDYRTPSYVKAFDYDDVILENRGDAEYVLDQMYDAIKAYGLVTVSDLCELIGVTAPYTANKYGWTDLNSAGIERVRGGYLLKLPRAFPID